MWQLVADSFAGAGYPNCQAVGRMLAEIVIQPSSWYEKHDIHLIAGKRECGQAQRRERNQQTDRRCRGLNRPRVLGWPRHNGAPIVTAKEHADEQTEPEAGFRTGTQRMRSSGSRRVNTSPAAISSGRSLAEYLGFSIWLLWSIVVTKLPQAGFHYTTDQLFQLVALPGLIGSLARFPYAFAPAIFGGRNWTIFSAAVLFIPTLALAYFVTQPETPFWLMLIVAATAGLGGGNFASSMANISFFYPARMKGTALGLNAAGGNIGVSVVQFLTPLLLGFGFVSLYLATPTADGLYLQNAGLMWIVPLTVAVIGAYLFMNNLTVASASLKEQLVILKRKQNWVMSYIYIGTFGSFIGYSAAFPLLMKTQFPEISVGIAFLGPLVGSVIRPFGGLLSDKVGGAKVTFWVFIAMCGAVLGVMYFVDQKKFAGFLTMFLALFVLTGVGNGSTYMTIPAIFRAEKLQRSRGPGRDWPRARAQSSGARSRGRDRLHRRSRRLRRLPHPARVRRLHCRNRWALSRASNLPSVLHHLHLRSTGGTTCASRRSLADRTCEHEHQPLATTAVGSRRQRNGGKCERSRSSLRGRSTTSAP